MTPFTPARRRLAIVGCGAAARICHLPALAPDGPFRLAALVDRVGANAADAARLYQELRTDQGLSTVDDVMVTDDLDAVLPGIDAAIIATAHASHVDLAVRLLRAGKHVLVEKPLALTVAQCEQIRAAAAESGAVAMPAHVRRLFPSARWVRSVLDGGRLGAIRRAHWSEGHPYSWPLVSPFMFGPSATGGGVLADSGPHVLDMLLYWFGEPAEVATFADNTDGGTDSEVSIDLQFGPVPVEVELSRLRELSNTCVIEGEHGSLRVDTGFPAQFVEYDAAGTVVASGPVPVLAPAQDTWVGLFHEQLADFDRVIDGQPTQLAALDAGITTVRLIEECRSVPAAALARPWTGPDAATHAVPTRVAVTGATGFIGSTIVDRLLAGGGHGVAIARNLARLARLSQLDPARLAFATADALDRSALTKAFEGCDVVVHTVYGSGGSPDEQQAVTVDGTAIMLEAAIAAGVRRIVYLSTVAVYDPGDAAVFDEDGPTLTPAPGDQSYGATKLAAEQHIMAAGAGRIEVVSLQPTVVYGPWGPSWTVGPLRRLPAANDTLPSGAFPGTCNAVHVQDVADAVLFAAGAPGLDGARLLVSGPHTASWGEYYDGYRELLGLDRPRDSDVAALDDWERDLYNSAATADIGRLRAAGFEPRVGLERGMAQVADWARWAGLI
jgi:predicted dehydrogenase/nucleoside-diphosphate-sugar epimerase